MKKLRSRSVADSSASLFKILSMHGIFNIK